MHRTTVELNEELLDQARATLGTSGIKETIEAAFAAVVRAERLRRFAEDIAGGVLIELRPELRDEMWR